MKTVFRHILPYVLSLLVCLTGQGVAASRGMDAAVGQMVLCTGTGPVMVYVDDTGQPTHPPHYCPDHALSLLGAIHVDAVAAPAPPRRSLPAPVRQGTNLIADPVPLMPARSPPVSV